MVEAVACAARGGGFMVDEIEAHVAPRDVARDHRAQRWIVAVLAVGFLTWSGLGVERTRTVVEMGSGGMRAGETDGAESAGGTAPFALRDGTKTLSWSANDGVAWIRIAVVPAGQGSAFSSWLDSATPAAREVGGTEFSTSDHAGTWDLSGLPAGDYVLMHSWRTIGRATGEWSFAIRERSPWLRSF